MWTESQNQANELQTDEQSKVDLRLQPNDKNTEQPSSSSTTDDLLNLDSPSPDKNEVKVMIAIYRLITLRQNNHLKHHG